MQAHGDEHSLMRRGGSTTGATMGAVSVGRKFTNDCPETLSRLA